MTQPEPRNPFYILLMAASFLFVVTALGVALVPVLEDKARQAGQQVPPSAFRSALRHDGWQWLLYEVAAVVVFAVLSMVFDRLRTLQKQKPAATIPPADEPPKSS